MCLAKNIEKELRQFEAVVNTLANSGSLTKVLLPKPISSIFLELNFNFFLGIQRNSERSISTRVTR
jgi:hypothetical protein